METNKNKRKLGWFGWSLISISSIAIIVTLILFFNVFNVRDVLNIENLENAQKAKETEGQEVDAETAKEIEEIQETVGAQHSELGEFIAETHDFYNDKTGYGNINSLNWKEQAEMAEIITETIEDQIDTVQSDALKTDLNTIHEIAADSIENGNTDQVRLLHRYFHDLDIALNHYNGSDKIWKVTETLKQ
ncbi:hypothetical protein [Oceanobacillus manasiensis]|uniref:hypothetical protein n=1 Tax=Oceanobacillus manasiensis TaxID=586413 RepID=UPI0005AB8186|nr:hypothetical protein [Oceanobacillus manasiensis]